MRLTVIWGLAALAAMSSAAPSQVDPWDALAAKSLAKQTRYHATNPDAGNNCDPRKASVRREWYVSS